MKRSGSRHSLSELNPGPREGLVGLSRAYPARYTPFLPCPALPCLSTDWTGGSCSASQCGFPHCKTGRHITLSSVFVSGTATPSSAVVTPAASLEPAPSTLPLCVSSSSSTTVLSASGHDGFTTVLNKGRHTSTAQPNRVSVSSPQPISLDQELPVFWVHVQDGFQTSYNAVCPLKSIVLLCWWDACQGRTAPVILPQIHQDLPTPAGCRSQLHHHQGQAGSAWPP